RALERPRLDVALARREARGRDVDQHQVVDRRKPWDRLEDLAEARVERGTVGKRVEAERQLRREPLDIHGDQCMFERRTNDQGGRKWLRGRSISYARVAASRASDSRGRTRCSKSTNTRRRTSRERP